MRMVMPIGVSTLPYWQKDVLEASRLLAAQGFRLIEIMCEEPHGHPDHLLGSQRLKNLKKLANRERLTWLIHAPVSDINLMSPNTSMRQEAERQLVQTIRLAVELQCPRIVFHVGGRPRMGLFHPETGFRQGVTVVGNLLKEAEGQGITLLLENDPPVAGLQAVTPEECHRFAAYFGGSLGFLLDVGHAHLVGQEAVNRFIQRLLPYLQGVHISDNRGSMDEHLGIGQGTLDMDKVMKSLQEAGFQGELILELLQPSDLMPGKEALEGMMHQGGSGGERG